MKLRLPPSLALLLAFAGAGEAAEPLDRLGELLTFSPANSPVRARLSGLLDLEYFEFARPAPAFVGGYGEGLFSPRLTLFLDAQLGRAWYLFAQARADRGFDPGPRHLRGRLDEYALRFTPFADGRIAFQAGQFSTVVGNWVTRHDSWTNPFVTAPMPYENVTGIWDAVAVTSTAQLLNWAGLGPAPLPDEGYPPALQLPILWGPAYTSGAAVMGTIGRFDYAAEFKNAAVSSRPREWTVDYRQWDNPTMSARIGFRPNAAWNFGLSASRGSYLQERAKPTIAPGTNLGDYRQVVFAHDLSYAWHHVQIWAEIFHSRFEIPRVGTAETTAYYVEARYKFTPQFFGAIRWNQQWYGSLPRPGSAAAKWGRDTWRIDVAPTYRFTAHTAGKLQYTHQYHPLGRKNSTHLFAAQLTTRF